MLKETRQLKLPEGIFDVEVLIFQHDDREKIRSLYKRWRSLCDDLISLESRALPLPEGLSESVICLEMGWYRVNSVKGQGFNSSFDCYDPKSKKRIQIKATSIKDDLSSFGPKSEWDLLCFLDFYKLGNWDLSYDMYLLEAKTLSGIMLNASKGETFKAQQMQGRRPRLSIKNMLIKPHEIKPTGVFKI